MDYTKYNLCKLTHAHCPKKAMEPLPRARFADFGPQVSNLTKHIKT